MEMTLIIAPQLHDAMKVHHVRTEALTTVIKKETYTQKKYRIMYTYLALL